MKYRSRTDIAAEILKIALEGATKTRIMYGAYLSYRQIGEYLDALIENGMISYERRSRIYATTEKGKQYCEAYGKMGTLKMS